MSNTDLIRHLRAEHAKHFDALGDLLFDAARALEAAEADRTYRLRTRPVMLSYAVTAAGREPKPEGQEA